MGGINDYTREYSKLTTYEKKFLESLTTLFDQAKEKTEKINIIIEMSLQKYEFKK